MFCSSAEFINLISSESNEVCNREERRTIAPEHVLKALEVLNLILQFFFYVIFFMLLMFYSLFSAYHFYSKLYMSLLWGDTRHLKPSIYLWGDNRVGRTQSGFPLRCDIGVHIWSSNANGLSWFRLMSTFMWKSFFVLSIVLKE